MLPTRGRSDSHGEVGDEGVGRNAELEKAVGGGRVPIDHDAGHRGEGVAGDDGGLDGELLDVRLVLLQGAAGARELQKNRRVIKGSFVFCSDVQFLRKL